MRRFRSSSLFTAILVTLTAGVLAVGCSQETMTGPTPPQQQEEEVEVDGNFDKDNDTSTDDPQGGHNH
jgi:hypothetical protein